MPTPPPRTSLRRAIATLLAGGLAAQALPLALGPWLTRLYSPAEFGHYHLFAAVAANLAVVACARYEFALPLAADEAELQALRRLCRRLLALSTALTALGALGWWVAGGQGWVLWLPAAVGLLGLVSLRTLLATRRQRFRALAWARMLQHGGGALAQWLAGLAQAGVQGLIAAPLAATALAAWWLRPAPASASRATPPTSNVRHGGVDELRSNPPSNVVNPALPSLAAVARKHRDFPLWNTPHAWLGTLQDALALALITHQLGVAAAGAWGLALRYLKAPATLVGGAVSQVLYPRLAEAGAGVAGRALVVSAMGWLALAAAPFVALLWWMAPPAFAWAFGEPWRAAGDLARALALYIGLHFVASPLGVVTLAWQAQPWALKLALVGQAVFIAALALGLQWRGLEGAGWAVSLAMAAYFGWYFFRLATWPAAAP